jgi:hypothetical protein
VRLVQQLERQPRPGVGVAARDPVPQREEVGRVAVGIGAQLVEVVDVEHDVEVAAQRRLDRRVDALECGVGGSPLDRQPDRVEAGLPHEVEVPLSEPPRVAAVERAAEADAAHRREVCGIARRVDVPAWGIRPPA